MADSSFALDFVTPTGGVKRLTCDSLVVTLLDGETGILKGHAPLMAAMPAGIVRVRSGDMLDRYEVGESFLQITERGTAIFSSQCKKLS